MSQAVIAKQGDWISEALFAQPAFGLFKDLPGLITQIYKRFQPLGLQLSGIQPHNAENLGETYLRCALPGSTLRLFLDRLEISSILERGSRRHDQLGADLGEALQAHFPEVGFGTHTAILRLHGALSGARPEQVLARLASAAPKSPGSLLVAGAVFHYGADQDRLSSSLTIEPSVLFSDGLFLQARVIYHADKIQIDGLAKDVRRYLGDALAELDLALEEGT